MLAPEIFNKEGICNYRHYLWVRSGRTMNTTSFSRVMTAMMEEHLYILLKVSDWRQLARMIFCHLLNINLNDDSTPDKDGEEDNPLLQQFGHSQQTGQYIYGIEYNHLRDDFHDDAFAKWLKGFIELHQFQKLAIPAEIKFAGEEKGREHAQCTVSQLTGKVQTLLDAMIQRHEIQTIIEKELMQTWCT